MGWFKIFLKQTTWKSWKFQEAARKRYFRNHQHLLWHYIWQQWIEMLTESSGPRCTYYRKIAAAARESNWRAVITRSGDTGVFVCIHKERERERLEHCPEQELESWVHYRVSLEDIWRGALCATQRTGRVDENSPHSKPTTNSSPLDSKSAISQAW